MYKHNRVIVNDPTYSSGGYSPEYEGVVANEDGVRVYPGYLVEVVEANGSPTKVKPHSVADAAAIPAYVSDIHALSMTFIRNKHPLDEFVEYKADDPDNGGFIRYFLAMKGHRLYMRVAAGVSINTGDKMTSAGDGTLKRTTATDHTVFGVAKESIVGGSEPMNVLVEVI